MILPTGPQTPGFIQMIQWILRPMQLMEECTQRYGDIFTLRLLKNFAPLVFVSNPQAVQQILTSDTKEFEAPGEANMIMEPLLGKNSVITVSGARHQRQRQLLMPPFHGERMRTYADTISNITDKEIKKWGEGKPFCVRTSTQAITLGVMMQAVFGLTDTPRAQKIEKLLGETLDEASSPLAVTMLYFPLLRDNLGKLIAWNKFLERQKETDKLIYEEIQERRDNPDSSRTDILSLLMEARDEAGEPMTDEELRDELLTLLFAGHETTATALAWALYWIHKLPEVRQKLLAEIDSVGDNPDAGTIFKLPYLNAVCNETLRIYPVAMLTFARIVKTPVSVMGYEMEPGTPIMGSIYLVHQREDLYPEPKKFKPERFLERQFSAYEFMPFGGGVRRCIGLAFAQFEMKVALFEMLSRVELALADNRDVKAKRRGLVTAPERSIKMVVKSQRVVKSRELEPV